MRRASHKVSKSGEFLNETKAGREQDIPFPACFFGLQFMSAK
jgi:hypothetical protein